MHNKLYKHIKVNKIVFISAKFEIKWIVDNLDNSTGYGNFFDFFKQFKLFYSYLRRSALYIVVLIGTVRSPALDRTETGNVLNAHRFV